MITKSSLYDALFKDGQEALADGPCQIKRGKDGVITCLYGRGSTNSTWCCESCEHLTRDGCSVQALGCKVWACRTLVEKRPDVVHKLNLIRERAWEMGVPAYVRASKEQNFRTPIFKTK